MSQVWLIVAAMLSLAAADNSSNTSLMQPSDIKSTEAVVSQGFLAQRSQFYSRGRVVLATGTYITSDWNSPCPSGSSLINDQSECFQAYNAMKEAQRWSGGTLSGTWPHVMQCGVHMAYGRGLNNGNTKIHYKTNKVDGSSPGEDWLHICKVDKYIKAELNAPCPSGYAVIDNQNECFEAYNSMRAAQGWTGGYLSGTWPHVMQCGVHIAYGRGLNNGNTKVHFKTNGVDGSSPGEDWVHLCKAKPRYVQSELNSPCPSGYAVINNQNACFEAYNSLKDGQRWSGGTLIGTWPHVMQCGVHIAYGRGLNNGNTKIHFKTNHVDGSSPGEDWLHLCQAI